MHTDFWKLTTSTFFIAAAMYMLIPTMPGTITDTDSIMDGNAGSIGIRLWLILFISHPEIQTQQSLHIVNGMYGADNSGNDVSDG